MTDVPGDNYRRELIDTVDKADDLEIHTSVLTINGSDYVDFREFIPSLGQYGRGVTFPARLMPEAANGLLALADRWDSDGSGG